ncbi:hypothetical protein ACW73S_03145 [Faecalibacterium duncaniae]
MGTIKRLNDQQKQQAQAEAAMPGAYENRYDEGIQNALAGMDSANSAGLGFDSQNGTYRGALSRLFGNAGAGASAAEQVANSLSGGYGTDWAKSAAQQAAAGETGQTANVYAQARADALSQWQQELAGRGTQLDNLLTQDGLARSEYDGSVADAANWRNYRYGRTQQARQENSDFLNNVWNVIKNVGSDVGKAYDAYMGYSQQKANAITQAKEEYRNGNVDGAKAILRMYRMDENMFDNLQGVSDFTVQQNAALKEAYEMLDQGVPEAAISKFLEPYDLSYDMFDEWKGLSQTDKDNLDYLMKAQDYTTAGAPTLGQTIARAVGYGTDALDSFDSVTNRLNQADIAKYASQLAISNRYKTTTRSGSGGTSRSTKSRSSKVDGYTQPQLNTMLKEYSTMKPDDQRRSYYEDTLADAGRIQRLTGTGNPGKANGTAWEQGMYNARKMANSGYSQNQIASELANNTSLSSDQISAIMNQIDYEWRGTK